MDKLRKAQYSVSVYRSDSSTRRGREFSAPTWRVWKRFIGNLAARHSPSRKLSGKEPHAWLIGTSGCEMASTIGGQVVPRYDNLKALVVKWGQLTAVRRLLSSQDVTKSQAQLGVVVARWEG